MASKKKRQLLACALIAAVSVSLVNFSSRNTTAYADSLSSLRDQYNQLQKEQQELQSKVNDLDSKVSSEEQKKSALDQNASVIKQQIAVLNTQIDTTTDQLDKKSDEIKSTQNQINTDKEEYQQQVVAIYEAGSASKLELLLTSNSVSQFLTRFQVIKDISDHDTELINNLHSSETELQSDKKQLQSELVDLQSSQGSLAAKREVLNAQIAKEDSIVKGLKSDKDEAQAQTDDVAEKARETDAEINAEIAREAEARRRQLESEENQPGQSGSVIPHGGSVSGSYIVNYARGFIGTPYVFGSADPSVGFDCSGFVQYVYANAAGIALTHSAAAQYGEGTPISESQLKPGDLVFFDVSGGGIDHVGIYSGGGMFIEANYGTSSPKAVIETSMESAYWAPKYAGAVRIE